jgi:hypothetical protein
LRITVSGHSTGVTAVIVVLLDLIVNRDRRD